MSRQISIHTAYDGTITFKDAINGKAIGYAGWAGFIASIIHTQGWRAYGSPSQEGGYFIALQHPHIPEDLPIDPGFHGWHRLQLDDLLDFAGDDGLVI
ncbi:hypothetical protein CCC_01731 [Paramagnetospirillum magnetotacticum MS-1]|uniref:Uncharacterized protein n=1 Tax=Paramagnetospirillum magnetotacticum MS-1 TaxID=272627 RepID=A0A0C2V6Q8_PARME|nr:hypothetical protein [Paramagnetospirillum magnetotacticum]KIM00737.1 hypothetical protein CCC_01731 [Paramagnetospirillum magnetotacticum MS-1]